MTVNMRRLPVYLLLDCSESMAGSAMEAVNQGVAAQNAAGERVVDWFEAEVEARVAAIEAQRAGLC